MTRLDVAHVLPGRLRLRFQPPLPITQASGIQQHLQNHWPHLSVRLWGVGKGLVIENPQAPLAPDLVTTLLDLLHDPPTHQPQAREALVQALMALAVLGWALPLLPGTPFFLLAVALRTPRP